MAKSISRIMDQIERLQAQAEAIQQEAIVRIRREIAQLGLTPEHLFGAAPKSASKARAKPATNAAAKSKPKSKTKTRTKTAIPKFADEAGNTWGGIGKRPEWLRQALAAGKAIEDFLVDKRGKAAAAAKGSKAKGPVKPKSPAKAKTTKMAAPKKASPKVAPTAAPMALKAAAKNAAPRTLKAAPVAAETAAS